TADAYEEPAIPSICPTSSAIPRLYACGYCARRILPSFPTRRSSDLARSRAGPAQRRPQDDGRPRATGRQRPDRHREKRRASAGRSEEHTSELQSPCNLVCRLLLEKKEPE